MFNDKVCGLESPCYDNKTKTDCPRRCAGCASNCPDWAAYVEERDRRYKKHLVEAYGNPAGVVQPYARRAESARRHNHLLRNKNE